MTIENLCSEVFEIAKQLVPDGLAHGAQGNISACDRASGLVAVTPSAIPYRVMKLDDIVVTDLFGKVVKGKWTPTTEIQDAYHFLPRTRTDVNAVVHTHAPYASVFCITHEQIPPVLTEAASCLTGPVPVAPYRAPGSAELAQIVLDTIGTGVAVLSGSARSVDSWCQPGRSLRFNPGSRKYSPAGHLGAFHGVKGSYTGS